MTFCNVYVEVITKDGQKHVDAVTIALNEFKKRIKKSGIMQDMQKKEFYRSPSAAKKFKKNESIKQKKRHQRKNEWYKKTHEPS